MSSSVGFVGLLVIQFIATPYLACSGLADEPPTPLIAVDDEAVISDIIITRRKWAGAVASADFTNLQFNIRFTGLAGPFHLLRLTNLEPIQDNLGKDLLTEKRRSGIWALEADQVVDGTSVYLRLDAPTRAATTLKRVKGTAEVCTYAKEVIVFKDLASLIGEELDHAFLKGVSIVPRIEKSERGTSVELVMSGSPDRVLDWRILKQGQVVDWMSSSTSPGAFHKTVGFHFQDLIVDGDTQLWLTVAKPGEKKGIEFEFNDVELP